MLEAAGSALQNLFTCPCVAEFIPARLFFLFFGVLIGLSLGAIPGLSGLVGLAMLLPFTFDMDRYAAFAMLIGLSAVTTTSDTIPSVLFSVPGTTGSQATILDGHPMAKKGEAGRAFGAAYMSSLVGGIFGALLLALSIPVVRPLVMVLGSPEFFMLALWGISMVAVLSGGAPIKGLIAGAMGLAVGMIGMDPQSGVLRWYLGQLYLWDGIPLVPVTLGIFAIPEIVDLVIKGTRIADVPQQAMKGVCAGIRDTFRNWFLVLRCSALGVWVGFIPGLGVTIVDWFAYGHAVQTTKGAHETFGKGDVRGVIAPESANNAKEGGALIPTIAFGVPGSASMALLLAAFMIQGLVPGPDMLTTKLDVTYTMIWSLAIANVLGTGICLAFTPQLAKIATFRIHLLAPLVITVIFLAAFQATAQFADLVTLLLFSIVGWFMKRFSWPRPPLILGLVLSRVIERYLFISMGRYGFTWVSRPVVLVILIMIILSLAYGFRQSGSLRPVKSSNRSGAVRFRVSPAAVFTVLITVVFLVAVVTARNWSYQARLFPWTIGISALCLCLIQLALDLRRAQSPSGSDDSPEIMDLRADRAVSIEVVIRRGASVFGWILGYFAAIWLVGFIVATPLFIWLYLALQAKERWRLCLLSTSLIMVFLLGVFHYILHIPWPQGALPWFQNFLLELIGS